MHREREREWLDVLPSDDPQSVDSRQDLKRLNWWMRNAQIVAKALHSTFRDAPPRTLVEIGAGDGDFLASVAKQLKPNWRGVSAILVDRQYIVARSTIKTFESMDWHISVAQRDVLNWIAERTKSGSMPAITVACGHSTRAGIPVGVEGIENQCVRLNHESNSCTEFEGVILANLFLHHFSEAELIGIFAAIGKVTNVFVACEPRRSRWGVIGSHLIGCIGCNAVTRHDAVVSVRAGFHGNELSSLWADQAGWVLDERAAGLFSHLFVATRRGPW